MLLWLVQLLLNLQLHSVHYDAGRFCCARMQLPFHGQTWTLGALASGVVVWQLVPSEWTLPFWTTLKATVDAEKYGHAVEHYAEGVVMMMTFAAVIGGATCVGGVALGTKLLRRFVRP
jgi:hypothetical protein